MATHSLIGLENTDGTIDYIYCHFDGYPSGVGKKLVEYYDNENRIKQLLDLGDISVLGRTPFADIEAWNRYFDINANDELCRTYRTRGDTDIDYLSCKSLNAYFIQGVSRVDYIYLYRPSEKKWFYVYSDVNCDWSDWVELEPHIYK